MQANLIAVLEALLIASSLSLDAFTAGFAYGSKKIKIPMLELQVVNIICSAIVGIALFAGTYIKDILPAGLTSALSFVLLFSIGLTKLLDSITKSLIKKHTDINKKVEFSIFNFKFILNLYANPEKSDVDNSKNISIYEAALLALSLSIDGIAVGFGAALGNVNAWAVFFCSLITDLVLMASGNALGKKLSQKLPFNVSWLAGAVLIALAFSKLF